VHTYVRIKSSEEDTEDEMTVILVRIDQPHFNRCGDDWHSSRFDTEADQSHDDGIGVLETSLRLPQDAHESAADQDIRNDGAHKPKPRKKISNVVEGFVVYSLVKLNCVSLNHS
jgi:hypothetical protein